MNDYLTIDSYKYRTSHKSWRMSIQPLATSRVLLDGSLDVTHGPTTLYLFAGEIMAEVSPDTGFGSILNLRATLEKKQAFTLSDHYGTAYTVHAIGPFIERSLSPKWDSATNIIYVQVQFRGKKN